MSSFSSLSSLSGLPSPANSSKLSPRSDYKAKVDYKEKSRQTRSPRARLSQTIHATTENGCRDRCLDLERNSYPAPQRIRTPVPTRKPSKLQYGHVHSTAGSPSHASLNSSPSSPKLRGCLNQRPASPASSLSCNEASGPAYGSHFNHQASEFQTHHHRREQHAFTGPNPNRRFTPGAQVHLASPISPAVSSSPCSLVFPSTPQNPRVTRYKQKYAYLTPQASVSSFSTAGGASSPRVQFSYPEPSTPSLSPRSHKSRSHSSNTSTPSRPPPPTFLIRRGLIPQRASPTLAMSMQIHSPSPIMSSRPLSPPLHSNTHGESQSKSRSSSPLSPSTQLPPLRPPMTRPPSRSEKLLRDTLRRAEEQERMANLAALPSPPLFAIGDTRRHVRRDTSSSTGTSASLEGVDYYRVDGYTYSPEEEVEEVDEEGWFWRTRSATSASSSSSYLPPQGHHYQPRSAHPQTQLSRNKSLEKRNGSGYMRSRAHTDPTGEKSEQMMAFGAPPTSPTPARAQLQRPAKSAPNGSRASHSHRTSLDGGSGERSGCGCLEGGVAGMTITPHEAVLRSRLEGVLKGVKEQERRTKSRERDQFSSGSGSGASNSMASSRNLSSEGEWFFGPSGETSYTISPMSSEHPSVTTTGRNRSSVSYPRPPAPRSPPSSHAALRPPTTPQQNKRPSPSSPRHLSLGPLTPPPTPPFNARTAAAQCKAMDGYVSFANIEGLGVPDGADDEEDDQGSKKWSKWFSIGSSTAKVGRGRSDSANSMASR